MCSMSLNVDHSQTFPERSKPQKQKELSAPILLSSVHASGLSFVYNLYSSLLPTYYYFLLQIYFVYQAHILRTMSSPVGRSKR